MFVWFPMICSMVRLWGWSDDVYCLSKKNWRNKVGRKKFLFKEGRCLNCVSLLIVILLSLMGRNNSSKSAKSSLFFHHLISMQIS